MMPEKFLAIFLLQIIVSVVCISRKKKILSYVFELAIPTTAIIVEIYLKCFDLIEVPIYLLTYIMAKIVTLIIIIQFKKTAFHLTVDLGKKGKKSFICSKIMGKKSFARFLRTYNTMKYGPVLKLGNPGMANKTHSVTKVKFDKMGFPKFKSYFTVKLKRKYWRRSREVHFYHASKALYAAIMKDKRLAKKFTKKEIELFSKGDVPKRYTWHHYQDAGVLQLVEYKIHSDVSHIGGFSIWGKKEKKKK